MKDGIMNCLEMTSELNEKNFLGYVKNGNE